MRASRLRRRYPVRVSPSSRSRPKATSCQLRRARARSPKAPEKASRPAKTGPSPGGWGPPDPRPWLERRKPISLLAERVAEPELRVVGEEAGDVAGDAPDEEGVDQAAAKDLE